MIFSKRILALCCGGLFLFLYAPIMLVVLFSFNAGSQSVVWEGASLRWYEAFFNDVRLIEALGTSLVIALISALCSVCIGTAAAIGVLRCSHRVRTSLERILMLPLLIPDIVLGILSLILFSLCQVTLGWVSIIFAHTVFCTALVVLVVSARLVTLPLSQERAAYDLGASYWQYARFVLLPQLTPAMIAALLLSFILSLDDFTITFFVAGSGVTTIPLRMYSLLRFGVNPSVHALSTVQVLVSCFIVSLSLRFDSFILRKS